MKGGPEQSFLEEFSDRFMDHVRQVKIREKTKKKLKESAKKLFKKSAKSVQYDIGFYVRCARSRSASPGSSACSTTTRSPSSSPASSRSSRLDSLDCSIIRYVDEYFGSHDRFFQLKFCCCLLLTSVKYLVMNTKINVNCARLIFEVRHWPVNTFSTQKVKDFLPLHMCVCNKTALTVIFFLCYWPWTI